MRKAVVILVNWYSILLLELDNNITNHKPKVQLALLYAAGMLVLYASSMHVYNIPYISCYVTRVLILRIINIKWFKLFLV